MSQDMMQTLSGSSLISLSVGTLPAVKSGMMLDANPFASQLALLTEAEGGLGAQGVAIPGLGNGSFAIALAAQTGVDAGQKVSEPVEIAALPDDASPTQILAAVLQGKIAPETSPQRALPDTVKAGNSGLEKFAPQSMPETVDAQELTGEAKPARPRHASKPGAPDAPAAAVADPASVTAAFIPPAIPASVRPEAIAPETGTVRTAISTKPAPARDTAGVTAPVESEAASADFVPGVPAEAAAVASSFAAFKPAQPTTRPVADRPAAARTIAAPSGALATPAAGAPAIADSKQIATSSIEGAAARVSASPASPPATVLSPPDPVGTPDVQPETAIPVVSSEVPPAAQVLSAVQHPRPAAPAPRANMSIAGQRAIQAASQAARPAQALGAVFDLADPATQPVSAPSRLAAPGGKSSDIIPPSWAAALNAVISPTTGQSLQELAAPLATGSAETAPLETLAFDADFVGSVETQIARVIGGGQMVRMQISPEHLGRIDIEMLAGPERDHVRITTEHDAVRDTLVQSQVRLEQDLRNGSQRTADVTVELRQQSPGAQGGSAQQQQRGQSGQEAGAARDTLARQTAVDAQAESTPAQRRQRGNVRYA